MKEQTVYTQVPVSERRPEGSGWYNTDIGYLYYAVNCTWIEYSDSSTSVEPEYWFERKENQIVMNSEDFAELKNEMDTGKGFNLDHIKRMCCWIFDGDYIHTVTNSKDLHTEIIRLVDLYSTFPQFYIDTK